MKQQVLRLMSRFCGFSLIGVVSTLLSVGIMAIMNECAGINGYVSYVTAYVVTILFSYFANALLVYKVSVSIAACVGFFVTYISGMVVGTMLLAVAKQLFPGANDTFLGCAVLPFTVVWNFVFINCILTHKRHTGRREPFSRKTMEADYVGKCV